MNALPPQLYVDLIGRPYRADARGPDAYDCVGLVMAVLVRMGVALPTYHSTAEELEAQLHDGMLGPCRAFPHAAVGCVVLLRAFASETAFHLGIMVDQHRMLHASAHYRAVVLEVLQRSAFRRRVLGFYVPEPRL